MTTLRIAYLSIEPRALYIVVVKQMATERVKISDPKIIKLCGSVGWTNYYAVGWVQTWRDGVANGTYPACGTPMQMAMGMPSYEPCEVMVVRPLVDAGFLIEDGDMLVVTGCDALLRKRRARQAAGRLGGMARAQNEAKRRRKTTVRREVVKKEKVVKKQTSVAVRGADFWPIYDELYHARYGVPPLRNKKTNSQMSRLLESVGASDLPRFLRFFMGHPDYAWSKHEIGLALQHAFSLRTQMLEGKYALRDDMKKQGSTNAMAAQLMRIKSGELG